MVWLSWSRHKLSFVAFELMIVNAGKVHVVGKLSYHGSMEAYSYFGTLNAALPSSCGRQTAGHRWAAANAAVMLDYIYVNTTILRLQYYTTLTHQIHIHAWIHTVIRISITQAESDIICTVPCSLKTILLTLQKKIIAHISRWKSGEKDIIVQLLIRIIDKRAYETSTVSQNLNISIYAFPFPKMIMLIIRNIVYRII